MRDIYPLQNFNIDGNMVGHLRDFYAPRDVGK